MKGQSPLRVLLFFLLFIPGIYLLYSYALSPEQYPLLWGAITSLVIAILVSVAFNIADQWEKAVILRLGRLIVRDEILSRLGLDADTPQIVRGFARPNLALRARDVQSRRERDRAVDAVLEEALGSSAGNGCAIIYAPTRKSAEEESVRVAKSGRRTAAYHAGLSGPVRQDVHERFTAGTIDVVVATNAFGMGIDRPDVRSVIHLAPPGSLEAYYQEVGRAGRDGRDAIGLLLLSPGDMPLRRRLIEAPVDGRTLAMLPVIVTSRFPAASGPVSVMWSRIARLLPIGSTAPQLPPITHR